MGNRFTFKEFLDLEKKRYRVEVINTWATVLGFCIAVLAFLIAILK
jgi:hypothetical protein